MSTERPQITDLLRAWGQGDPAALDRLTPLVYEQLRRLAASHMRKERAGHGLQTTALVHEAYLRLVKIGELTAGASAELGSGAQSDKSFVFNGAEEGIRTPTILLPPAPQAGEPKNLSGSIFKA